jgi:hypothetical protein
MCAGDSRIFIAAVIGGNTLRARAELNQNDAQGDGANILKCASRGVSIARGEGYARDG